MVVGRAARANTVDMPLTPFRPLWLVVAGLLVGVASRAAAVQPTQPNILFLFADDYTFEAVRALGHLDVDTPNLDRLVARGTTFTHAYNMGSWLGAVCVASRT